VVSDQKEIATINGKNWKFTSVVVTDQKEIIILKGHTACVTSVAFDPTGQLLASGVIVVT